MNDINIETLRKQIDVIDDKVLQLLAERFSLCDAIGVYKKQNKLNVIQSERFNEVLESRKESGTRYGLSIEFVESLCQLIHNESVDRQAKV